MKTKLCLLLVMAFAICQPAYGQASASSTPQTAAVEPANTTFIILVPVSGPPVQYQYIGNHYITRHPAYYHHGYRHYGYGYGGYGGGYRNFYYSGGNRPPPYSYNPYTGAYRLEANRPLPNWKYGYRSNGARVLLPNRRLGY